MTDSAIVDVESLTPSGKNLVAELHLLADARSAVAMYGAEMAARRAAFDEENALLVTTLAAAGKREQELDARVRALALEHFIETTDKNPIPGVSIRMTRRVEYDRGEAFAWALLSNQLCLELDTSAFEKLVKAGMPCRAAQVVAEPQVTIAKDLRGALGLEPTPAPVFEGEAQPA
jgi:hypothetical protein